MSTLSTSNRPSAGTLTMQQIGKSSQNKKAYFLERLYIWKTKLVRQLDCYWNQLVLSLYLMFEKLEKLGLIFANGEVSYFGGNG